MAVSFKPNFFPFLFLLNLSTFTTYGIALAFFPSISKAHSLSSTITGLIFSFYPMGGIFLSFILPKLLLRYKKKSLLYFFQVFQKHFFIFIVLCI